MAVRAALLVALLLLPLLLFVPPASAQNEILYDFELTAPTQRLEVLRDVPLIVALTFRDLSRDTTNIAPGAPPVGVLLHTTEFVVKPGYDDNEGWFVPPMGSITTTAGDVKTVELQVQVHPQANNPFFQAIINATTTTQEGTFYREATISFFTNGIAGFSVHSGTEVTVGARETAQTSLRIFNFGVFQRGFDISVANNPCSYKVAPPASVVIPPRTYRDVPFTVLGPDSLFDPLGFNSQSCLATFQVVAQDNPALARTQTISVRVQAGVAVDPLTIFYLLLLILLLFLLFLFIRRRKERLEEQILGKPQKPWNIPVEKVFLAELKGRDPRAWYVVRHYLMDEEYRSSLLWFKSYKKATKGDRKRERLILQQERKYEGWKAKWVKVIAKPLRRADRFEAGLQRKLDRMAKVDYRKAGRRARKQSAKIQAAHAKLQKRADEKWEKQRAKAERKGRPVPPQPVMAAPDLPPQPVAAAPLLAGHKWAKKAARFRRRMVKRQGNLEVKFEKADVRYLGRVRRKVGRIARKLDDAEFVAEHPLLRGA